MQRFLTMEDTDAVLGRVEISVNMSFFDLLLTYPLGNGMGAGGTSIPYFLHDLIKEPVGMESEYARILLEQGIAGLVLWLAFIGWFVGRRPVTIRDPWLLGKQLLWFFSLASFAAAIIGTGLMTAIPQSMLFFLGVGFVAGARVAQTGRASSKSRSSAVLAKIERARTGVGYS
jgi:hypothetical protein